jgi:ferritin
MTKTVNTIEKNTSASFGYVKKDILMLNDSFSDLHDKFEKVLEGYSKVLNEINDLKKEVEKTKKPSKKKTISKK